MREPLAGRVEAVAPRRRLALLALGAGALASTALRAAVPDTAPAAPAATPSATPPAVVAGAPAVAVASSLRAVWPRLEGAWHETLPEVGARPTFGASVTLAHQIAQGAPFELFLAADEASVASLPSARVRPGSGAVYAVGRLALVSCGDARDDGTGGDTAGAANDAAGGEPDGEPAADDGESLARLAGRLAAEPALRVAIASPAHAPYGRAAREALDSAGLWPLDAGRLVTGENAAQTLQFVLAGAVDAALLPYSLVVDGPPAGCTVRLVDAARHAPIVHRLVAMADASPAALALHDWLLSGAARTRLLDAGFDAPP